MDTYHDLSAAYRRLGQIQATLYRVGRDIETAELRVKAGLDYKALGSNEAERKLALDVRLAEDGVVKGLREQETELKAEEIMLDARVKDLTTQLRADEWRIRNKLADALRAVPVGTNRSGGIDVDAGDYAFGDAQDHVVTHAAESQAADRIRQFPQPQRERPPARRPATAAEAIEDIWGPTVNGAPDSEIPF